MLKRTTKEREKKFMYAKYKLYCEQTADLFSASAQLHREKRWSQIKTFLIAFHLQFHDAIWTKRSSNREIEIVYSNFPSLLFLIFSNSILLPNTLFAFAAAEERQSPEREMRSLFFARNSSSDLNGNHKSKKVTFIKNLKASVKKSWKDFNIKRWEIFHWDDGKRVKL